MRFPTYPFKITSIQEFTEYGKIALETHGNDDSVKPFQKLIFLVRDWYHTRDAPYGLEGGQKILNSHLTVSKNEKSPEIHRIRNDIRNGFTDLSCFLMPHPGKVVAQCDDKSDLRLSRT